MNDQKPDKDTYDPARDSWKALILIAVIVAVVCWLLY